MSWEVCPKGTPKYAHSTFRIALGVTIAGKMTELKNFRHAMNRSVVFVNKSPIWLKVRPDQHTHQASTSVVSIHAPLARREPELFALALVPS
jgi:hypothetical protein